MTFTKRSSLTLIATLLMVALFSATPAHAQTEAGLIDIISATSAQDRGMDDYSAQDYTHPPIKLSPDKSELVRLDAAASSIIIGNPKHVSILADSAETLVLIPRAPGATQFTVLDKNGSVLMQRHVLVAGPEEKYLRIRRSCAGSDNKKCQPTSVFYCPDTCHEVMLGGERDKNGSAVDAAKIIGISSSYTPPSPQDMPDTE